MRKTVSLAAATIAGLALATGSGFAQSQPAEAPLPKEPVRVERPVSVEPVTIAVEDIEELALQLEQMRQRQLDARAALAPRGPVVPVSGAEQDDQRRPPAPGQRTIEIATPPIVNLGPEFRFDDATVRSGGHEGLPKLTLQQRQAVVEAFRRSLAKKKNRSEAQ